MLQYSNKRNMELKLKKKNIGWSRLGTTENYIWGGLPKEWGTSALEPGEG